jgi:hypothetical protein
VFQRGCLLESYDLARAAVMGAHGVLLPALQGFLLLSLVLFVSGMLWSERGLQSVLCREQGLSSVLCREQGLSSVLCREQGLSSVLCREQGLSSVLCREQGLSSVLCREQGLSSVLCCQPSAPLMEGAENEMAAQAGDTKALRTWSACAPRWGWRVW